MEVRAATTADIPEIQVLFREYAAMLPNDVCLQNFEAEVGGLPGLYGPPRGEILVTATVDGLAGCVALRPLSESVCEMKRLYIRPAFRSAGLGRKLVEAVIQRSADLGYQTMRLDTLPVLGRAVDLYRALHFREIPAYGGNPPGAICFERSLP